MHVTDNVFEKTNTFFEQIVFERQCKQCNKNLKNKYIFIFELNIEQIVFERKCMYLSLTGMLQIIILYVLRV